MLMTQRTSPQRTLLLRMDEYFQSQDGISDDGVDFHRLEQESPGKYAQELSVCLQRATVALANHLIKAVHKLGEHILLIIHFVC